MQPRSQNKANDLACSVVLKYGFKRDFNAWLASLGPASTIETVADLIQFNLAHAGQNAIRYEQARLDISEEMNLATDAGRYAADRAKDILLAGTNGIDAAMAGGNFDARLFGGATSAGIAARPRYPTVIVLFGFVPNTLAGLPADFNLLPQPFGIAFTGSASTPTLLRLAYAFEQAPRRRQNPPSAPPLKKDTKGPKEK